MATAAAIIVRKERELVALFRGAGATRPESARTPEELNIGHRLAFDRLVRRAVLRPVGEGRYYLDEPSWNALRGIRTRLLVAVIIVLMVVVAILIGTGVIAVGMGIPRLE